MANKNTKKTNKSNTNKKVSNSNVKKENVKKEEKVVSETKKVVKEEVKVEPIKKEVKKETKKEKKSFALTSKQKDLVLVLLVVVLLVVALVLTMNRKPKLDIELPIALEGEAGFTEITYSDYEAKMANKEAFLVVIVQDGCSHCANFKPVVEEVANEYKLPCYYLNLTNLTQEESAALGESNSYLRNNQWGTPTTLFMYGNDVVDSISGYVEKDKFVEFVTENFVVE